MTIYNLFQTGASCILYGLLVTATLMAIMYFFLKEYNKNIVRTIPFFITGVVLAVLLTIQSSLLIGAVKAKGMVDAAEIYITQLTENEYGTISTNELTLTDFTLHFSLTFTKLLYCKFIPLLNNFTMQEKCY